MISDPLALERLLDGCLLSGREVHEAPVDGSPEPLLVIEANPRELLAEWHAARALIPVTGRWPLATTTFGYGPGYPRLFHASAPARVTSSAGAAEKLAELRAQRSEIWEIDAESCLEETRRRCGSAPSAAEWDALLERDPSIEEVERWMLKWEEERSPTLKPEASECVGWADLSDEDCYWVFAPTSVPAEAVSIFDFYGADEFRDIFPAIVHSWVERFGALPVAHWGTMLQFVVERPPPTLDEAFDLAAEQLAVAYESFGSPPLSLREATRILWRRPTWFLHDRP